MILKTYLQYVSQKINIHHLDKNNYAFAKTGSKIDLATFITVLHTLVLRFTL